MVCQIEKFSTKNVLSLYYSNTYSYCRMTNKKHINLHYCSYFHKNLHICSFNKKSRTHKNKLGPAPVHLQDTEVIIWYQSQKL
jgi:hypothetical protein